MTLDQETRCASTTLQQGAAGLSICQILHTDRKVGKISTTKRQRTKWLCQDRAVKCLTLAGSESTIDTKVDVGRVLVRRSIVDRLQGPSTQPDVGAHLRRREASE